MDGNIHIERACEADAVELAALAGELFAIEPDFDADIGRQERGFRALLADSDRAVIFVARDCCDGRAPDASTGLPRDSKSAVVGPLAGMLSCQLVISTAQGGPSGLLEDLFVRPAWRGRGIASALVAAVEAWCCERGATRVQLLADVGNDGGLAFWERAGYAATRMVCRRKYLY